MTSDGTIVRMSQAGSQCERRDTAWVLRCAARGPLQLRPSATIKTKSHSFAVKCPFDFRFCTGVFIILAWLAISAARAQTASYALGMTGLAVGPSAGSNSVVLAVTPQTGLWTATANASWLHLSLANQSGAGSMNVIFSYDANPGATRSGSLTIAGQTLTVTQAGSTYVAAGPVVTLVGSLAMPVDTIGPFGLTVDSAGNAYTLFSDPGFNASEFAEWQSSNDSLVQVELPLIQPAGNILAADSAGNIYFATTNEVEEWMAASGNVVTLVLSGLSFPQGIAVDQAGNVYIADTSDYAIKEWTATNGNLTTLVSSGLSSPVGVAVDRAGNVYIADNGDSAVKEWIAANSNLTTVVSSGLNKPWGVAVDGAGNVYIADSAIREWTAANSNLVTVLSGSGTGLAVDGAGNVYEAFPGIQEQVHAFVDPTPKAESAAAGNDSLPAVLPVTQNLLAPFAPTTGQPWLAITGITNGVVGFSFTTNSGVTRTAYITLLGQNIPVTQAGATSTATYTLGATNRLEGPAQGNDSVALAVTIPTAAWTATANASWLHLSPANQNSTGSMNVIFSYDANPGPTRSGSLTIAGQTLTVTQAGSTYVKAGAVTTLVSSGLHFPGGVAVDSAGNVYIADSDNNAIKKWTAANNNVNTLVSSGLYSPQSLTLDAAGNVYIADTSNHAIKEWMAASSNVITLATSGDTFGVAVDNAGNVYFSDGGNYTINEWSPVNSNVATLVSSGLNEPIGVAVNQAGNVYIAEGSGEAVVEWSPVSDNLTLLFGSTPYYGLAVDGAGNVYAAAFSSGTIRKWTAASNTVSTLVASGLHDPNGVAVDTAGNVYIADTINNAIKELPYAFVDPTARAESAAAGNDSLPVVLPATENLLAPFAPTSDQSWLTITGIANGVVSFSFTANPGAARTAHITLLGQSISIRQEPFVTPPILTGAQMLSSGVFNFYFTDTPSAFLTVLSTTNLLLPGSNWTVVGQASNIGSNLFQFTDAQASSNAERFYRIRSP